MVTRNFFVHESSFHLLCIVGAFQNNKAKFYSWWRDGLVAKGLDIDVLRCRKWTQLLGIAVVTFILNCLHLFSAMNGFHVLKKSCWVKSFQSCHQGLYCPARSQSRGREEVDVGFNLSKVLQLIFCAVIYNRWYWVAFLGANMFKVHLGQTVPFIHQWGGTITNSLRLMIG